MTEETNKKKKGVYLVKENDGVSSYLFLFRFLLPTASRRQKTRLNN